MSAIYRNRGTREGFTLVELVIVMAILAILAALIVGAVLISRQQSRNTKLVSDAKAIQTALEKYYISNKAFPNTGVVDAYKNLLGSGKPLDTYLPGMQNTGNSSGTVCYNSLDGSGNYYVASEGKYYRYYIWAQTDDINNAEGWNDPTNICSGHHPTMITKYPTYDYSVTN